MSVSLKNKGLLSGKVLLVDNFFKNKPLNFVQFTLSCVFGTFFLQFDDLI